MYACTHSLLHLWRSVLVYLWVVPRWATPSTTPSVMMSDGGKAHLIPSSLHFSNTQTGQDIHPGRDWEKGVEGETKRGVDGSAVDRGMEMHRLQLAPNPQLQIHSKCRRVTASSMTSWQSLATSGCFWPLLARLLFHVAFGQFWPCLAASGCFLIFLVPLATFGLLGPFFWQI